MPPRASRTGSRPALIVVSGSPLNARINVRSFKRRADIARLGDGPKAQDTKI